jgi:plasmid stability protein
VADNMWDTHQVVAALKADRSDVESYTRILTETLGDALPEGMVEVERKRGLFGRGGPATALTVRTPDRHLELRAGRHGGVEAEIRQVVRGVVISRRPVGVDEWLAAFAEVLNTVAAQDAAAREALTRLFGP